MCVCSWSRKTKLTLIAISSSSSLIFSVCCVPCCCCLPFEFLRWIFLVVDAHSRTHTIHTDVHAPRQTCTTRQSIMRLKASEFIHWKLWCFAFTLRTLFSVCTSHVCCLFLRLRFCLAFQLSDVFRVQRRQSYHLLFNYNQPIWICMQHAAYTKIWKVEREKTEAK